MPTNFRFNNGGTITDFSDVFIRRDIFSTGGLWTWGINTFGNLGDNTRTERSSPVQTIAGGANWKEIGANDWHAAGIKSDGTLWTWGYENQLGDNTNIPKSSPVQTVAGGTNWKTLGKISYHIAAIKTDGRLWLWGNNGEGELGDNTNVSKSSPVQTVAGGTNWKQATAGTYQTAAIKTDGTLWTWGINTSGELGDNTTVSKSSPVQTVAGGTNWKQVSCGDYNYTTVAAIKTDGTLWLWGYNGYGQLGNNTRDSKSSPIQTVAGGTNWKQVSCGGPHTAAIKTNGTLWTWGWNRVGALGDGTPGDSYYLSTENSKSSPVQTVAGGTNWKQVSADSTHNTAAIKTDGTLWLWGSDSYGKLAQNGAVGDVSSPIQTVTGGTNWKQVSLGGLMAGAIRVDDQNLNISPFTLGIQGPGGAFEAEINTVESDSAMKLVIGSDGSIGLFKDTSTSFTISTPDSSITTPVIAGSGGVYFLPTAWGTPITAGIGSEFEVSYGGEIEAEGASAVLRLFGNDYLDYPAGSTTTTPWYSLSVDRTITMIAAGNEASTGHATLGNYYALSGTNNGTISIRRIGTTTPVANIIIKSLSANKEGD